MTETLPGSNQPTPDTTQISGESMVVLPNLSENKAPLSLTLTIDKSVSKVAAWVIGVVIASSMLIGAGCILCVWMIIAYSHAERESELLKYYVLENDAKMINAGLKKPEESVAKRLEEEMKK